MANTVPDITLNDGHTIPQLGFGVFQIEPEDTARPRRAALEVGYRHIDTAEMYGNEKEVGEAVRASGIDRGRRLRHQQAEQRLPRARRRAPGLRRDARRPRHRLRRPVPDPLAAADAVDGDFVDDLEGDGGVPARRPGALDRRLELPARTTCERLAAETDVVPAVNQIEVHPYLANDEVRAYDAEHGIATEAWSPIAQGKVLDDPAIVRIAERLGRTPAQVALRWHIQRGDIVFPKSVTPQRGSRRTSSSSTSSSTHGDVAAIAALDRGEAGRTGRTPRTSTGPRDFIPDEPGCVASR